MNLFLTLLLLWPSPKEEVKTVTKTYDVSSPDRLFVMINNVYGNVTVEPSTSGKVELELRIKINADDGKEMEQAKKDLELGEYLGQDSIVFYTKAPFIRDCDKPPFKGGWWDKEVDYSFTYNYIVKIPKQAEIYAKTVNDGEVSIRKITGTVKAWNVNGGVEILDASDVRKASSVNGDIDITFAKAPSESIDFNTVNGDFNLEFPNDLAAKIYFDTMNGEMFSAFDYKRVSPLVQESKKGAKYKISTKTGVEIGSGGPVLSFKSINGNVYIKKLN